MMKVASDLYERALVDEMMNTTETFTTLLIWLLLRLICMKSLVDAVRDVDLCIQPSCLALYQESAHF